MFPDHLSSTNRLTKMPFGVGAAPMRMTRLRGLTVISLAEAHKMGRVADALLDPMGRLVAALRVRDAGTGDSEHTVLRETVRRVGHYAVILDAPVDRGEDASPEREHLLDLKTFLGLEVVTDEGMLLGRIHDAEIDPQTLSIIEYKLTRHFWDTCLHTWLRVSAQHTLSSSKDVLIVPQSAVHTGASLSGGGELP